MQDITVSLIEFDQVWEDKEANFEIIEQKLKNCEADLILLPEMFQTGFSMNTALAENWKDSKSVAKLTYWAKHYKTAIYTSLMVEEDGVFYNRGVFVFPDGKVEYYDKRKSFVLAGEDKYFKNGNHEVIVNYLGWKFQLQICFDLRFPEIVRNRIEKDVPAYDAILYVANWPDKRIEHWNKLLSARAIENQCYVIACNRIGEDANKIKYSSSSKIIGFQGENLAIQQVKCEFIQLTLKMDSLINFRGQLPFLE